MRLLVSATIAGLFQVVLLPVDAAVPIAVNNASFEVQPPGGLTNTTGCVGSGCSFSVGVGAVPGWVNSGASGEAIFGVQVGNHFAFDNIPDGITVAYSNGPIISQTVGAMVQEGVTYTLQVDLGWRRDAQSFSAVADLLINGSKYMALGTPPTSGNWSTFTATYVGLASDVDRSITIELNSTTNGFPPQADFDNVRLVTSVPEPTSSQQLAVGLLGIFVLWRHRARSSRGRANARSASPETNPVSL